MKDIAIKLGLKENATIKQILAAIDDLLVSNEKLNTLGEESLDSITELEKQLAVKTKEHDASLQIIEQLKSQKARGAVSKKVIDENVKQFFKHNKEVKTIFVTDDGTIFLQSSFADDHKRSIGGLVQKKTQK